MLYRYIDPNGVEHFTEDLEEVKENQFWRRVLTKDTDVMENAVKDEEAYNQYLEAIEVLKGYQEKGVILSFEYDNPDKPYEGGHEIIIYFPVMDGGDNILYTEIPTAPIREMLAYFDTLAFHEPLRKDRADFGKVTLVKNIYSEA